MTQENNIRLTHEGSIYSVKFNITLLTLTILTKESFGPGQFASYHIYPYYPDFYRLLPEHEENTYLQYLRDINDHHHMPVVISEFGCPSSRGDGGPGGRTWPEPGEYERDPAAPGVSCSPGRTSGSSAPGTPWSKAAPSEPETWGWRWTGRRILRWSWTARLAKECRPSVIDLGWFRLLDAS